MWLISYTVFFNPAFTYWDISDGGGGWKDFKMFSGILFYSLAIDCVAVDLLTSCLLSQVGHTQTDECSLFCPPRLTYHSSFQHKILTQRSVFSDLKWDSTIEYIPPESPFPIFLQITCYGACGDHLVLGMSTTISGAGSHHWTFRQIKWTLPEGNNPKTLKLVGDFDKDLCVRETSGT